MKAAPANAKDETRVRLWAMTLEAYRLAHGADSILETPRDLSVGAVRIPATPDSARSIRIRYRPRGVIPRLSLHELLDQPDLAARTFQGKVVFLGFTALSEAEDRLMTPREEMLPGVEIQAHAYETLAAGRFLTDAPAWAPPAFGLLAALIAGLLFRLPPGPWAYTGAALLLASAHLLPHLCYRLDLVFPTVMPAAATWLTVGAGAVHQYFATRGRLARTEGEAQRYKQAIHLVTHEMRTPLTAIQGSSELMSRYNLTPEKQKQMAQMINSESKRLARMITTFLNLERLGDGAQDPKREPFPLTGALAACVDRARPLAERKQIQIELDAPARGLLLGDQELIEYAIYNLLTNAVKYSPEHTTVTVTCEDQGARQLRLAVRDQGIGMEEKDLKRIFDKFYRTRGAEISGIEGTGIGLSLVREIVTHHGGTVEVASKPGQGSCFTLLLPAQPSAVAVS
jgi:signal transduction histidine kinase